MYTYTSKHCIHLYTLLLSLSTLHSLHPIHLPCIVRDHLQPLHTKFTHHNLHITPHSTTLSHVNNEQLMECEILIISRFHFFKKYFSLLVYIKIMPATCCTNLDNIRHSPRPGLTYTCIPVKLLPDVSAN